jgi:lipopolysaccharide biosynthesis glycosyltransferase
MHFVAFHVEPSAAGAARMEASCSAFHAETDYRRLLDILFSSVGLHHPDATRAVLTDERTPLDSLSPAIAVRRSAVDPDRVMYSRLLAQIEYLQRHADGESVAFLDADMIVNANFDALLADDFDIALTYRSDPDMPLNGGVILVRAGRQAAAIRFLEQVRAIYAERFFAAAHWWGDQHALIAAVGSERFARRIGDRLTVGGVKLRFLPCDQYNFSPENDPAAVARPLPDKAILHFKGERKRLMPGYWNAHLAPREPDGSVSCQPPRSAMSHDPVRVFIGSGEASVLERKTMIYSLRKNSRRELDIWVFNGTHNAIERNNDPPVLAPMSLRVKYRNVTEFSLYRYLIPQLCGHRGRAIWVDSDMICLGDIGELFDLPMHGCDFLSIKAYDGQWGPSVMLIDCNRCRFDLELICDEIDAGKYTYSEFTRFSERFLAHHPYKIGVLDPNWNSFDHVDERTKLIHYTNLFTQPWKFPGHKHGALWHEYLLGAMSAGLVTNEDIDTAILRAYVRRDIREGNNPRRSIKLNIKKPDWLKRLSRRLRGKAA